ncbi:MAG: hypothetical protein ACM33V_00160, partial [Chloroflexota bacterium]
ARLRMAWYESMLAMNQLKKYMMGENKSLVKAFRWTMDTLPPKYKRNSVSYYQAFEVALISGLMLGAAAFFVQQAFFSIGLLHWAIAILAGIITVFIQLRVYRQTIK